MNFPLLVGINLALVLGIMFAMWLVSLRLRDASIVDMFWGFGFVVIAWVSFGLTAPTATRGVLLLTLVTLWGLRLGGYLTWRNFGKPEDYRYRAMRDKHGAAFPRVSLITVFGLQGLIMWFVAWPIQAAMLSHERLMWLDAVGGVVWGIGWVFETVGDYQLARFKADPGNQGRVMDRGLWRYTRHPNYFGDFMIWWGIYLVALAGGAWWTILSPLLMSFFLIRVSGVPMLEAALTKNRPGYVDYIQRTSSFFPMPPRTKSRSIS